MGSTCMENMSGLMSGDYGEGGLNYIYYYFQEGETTYDVLRRHAAAASEAFYWLRCIQPSQILPLAINQGRRVDCS